jgi:hypothetical protein
LVSPQGRTSVNAHLFFPAGLQIGTGILPGVKIRADVGRGSELERVEGFIIGLFRFEQGCKSFSSSASNRRPSEHCT